MEADGKNSDKANATRSKHSVTEQRRRSKINERHVLIIITIISYFVNFLDMPFVVRESWYLAK